MRLAAFMTITSPQSRGDLYRECTKSLLGLVDELVIVDGGDITDLQNDGSIEWVRLLNNPRIRIINRPWYKEFSWSNIGQSFQYGYEVCIGDWIFHCDSDFIWHEKDYGAIRKACENNNNAPALSFLKHQFILPDRFNLKSRLVVAVNKGKYGNRIRFDSGGDAAQPSIDGKYIEPGMVPDIRIPFYNYEKLCKTEAQIKDDVGRMARAWQRHFGEYFLGGPDDESAYEEWLKMQVGRFKKPQEHIRLEDHPAVMRETIANLRPDQWGFSGFGVLEVNDYARA